MKPGARAQAAIEVLEEFARSRRPAKVCLKDWGRGARYAGAGDRAAVSGLVLDALRHRASLAHAMQSENARALVIGALGRVWGMSASEIDALFAHDEHAPEPLCEEEKQGLSRDIADAPEWVRANVPREFWDSFRRAFGERALAEGQGFATRAPLDLRINPLRGDVQAHFRALKKIKAKPSELLTLGARVAAPQPGKRAAHVMSLPAFNKGGIEVQDFGSQIAAACAGLRGGEQVLDFCAGGGGKTLAFAAAMHNTGQVFAWDAEPRRLMAIWARLKRAGVRNVQVREAKNKQALDDLGDKMDVVFVDAPCTGTGTWRRRPDAKWRLSQAQLEKRMAEQMRVLRAAAHYVKPGGRLVYVTCSVLPEENEERVRAFLTAHTGFAPMDTAALAGQGEALTPPGKDLLESVSTKEGAIRLSPHSTQTDGFFIAALRRNGSMVRQAHHEDGRRAHHED